MNLCIIQKAPNRIMTTETGVWCVKMFCKWQEFISVSTFLHSMTFPKKQKTKTNKKGAECVKVGKQGGKEE